MTRRCCSGEIFRLVPAAANDPCFVRNPVHTTRISRRQAERTTSVGFHSAFRIPHSAFTHSAAPPQTAAARVGRGSPDPAPEIFSTFFPKSPDFTPAFRPEFQLY